MTTGEANQEQRAYWNDQAGPREVKLQQRRRTDPAAWAGNHATR